MKRFIPRNINWSVIRNQYPFPKGVTIDRLQYVLGFLTSRVAFDREQNSENPVPIHFDTMIKVITNFNIIKRYLLNSKILKTNGHYVVGKQSIAYSFCEPYTGALQEVEITDKRIIARHFKAYKKVAAKATRRYGYLKKFFNAKLKIDYPAIEQELEIVFSDIPALFEVDLKKPRALLMSASMIHNKEFYFSVGNTSSNRLYTNLSNLKKNARGYLSYDGASLSAADLSASQPFLLGAFLKNKMYDPDNDFIKRALKSCTAKVRHMIMDSFKELQSSYQCGNDLDLYIKLVQQKGFYEFFQVELNKILVLQNMPTIVNRDVIKKEMIIFFYCKNHSNGISDYRRYLKQIFKKHFPSVYRAIFLLKDKNHTSFSILLQCLERYLFLDLICPELHALGVEPIFTIHDCAISLKDNISLVKSVCDRIILENTGIQPNIKIENFERGKLF